MAKDKEIPEGHHIWPYSGNIHPVGDHLKITGQLAKDMHVPSGTEIHGEETGTVEFFYKPVKYVEGK